MSPTQSLSSLTLWVDRLKASPYAMSAFVALSEKGLPFECRPVDLAAGNQHEPAYRQASLSSRVPTMMHGDFTLSESSAIAEYLEDMFAPPAWPRLYPADPKLRARARQLQAWLRSDFMPIREQRTTECVFLGRKGLPLRADALLDAGRLFDAVEQLLPAGAGNLFGEWSIADTDLALMIHRLLLSGDTVPERIAAYARGQWQRPSVQAWVVTDRGEP